MSNLARVFLVACGLAALVASGILLFMRDVRGSIAAAVVAASALTLLGRHGAAPPSPRRTWLGLGLLGSGLVILGFSIVLVAVALVALFVLQLGANAVVAGKVGRMTLERLDHPAVMQGAEDLVRQFSAEGFSVIGGYRFRVGDRPAILTVMIGPARDRLAVVTDKVWQVVSRFDARSLVTSNSGVAPLPAEVLRQQVAGGRPAEIIRAHDAALTLLSGRSVRPEMFASDGEALEAVHQLETRAIAYIGKAAARTAWRMETERASATPLRHDDPDSLHRISAWLGT